MLHLLALQPIKNCLTPFFFTARILRAIRIAARLGFRFSRETAHFVKHLSPSILKLDRVFKKVCPDDLQLFMHLANIKMFLVLLLCLQISQGRLLMEMNYMLAYGSAEASLRLLWKFGLLEVLLPIQVWI